MKKEPLPIDVITLFPDFFKSPLNESIVKIAQKKHVRITIHDLRAFTTDKHRTCDDKPFGGGPGMVMKPEPLFKCIEAIKKQRPKSRVIFLTPQGEKLTQNTLTELSHSDGFILLCGHYEGVDQRVRDALVDQEISIGDYVLTGGEVPALCVIDGVIRLIPGVLGNEQSIIHESFQELLLDHPHYTRPAVYRSLEVPEVLRSGDHAQVEKWRHKKALEITKKRRKDLYTHYMQKKGKKK
jgi:tRNA (guanine37-N1)-methyltransferase